MDRGEKRPRDHVLESSVVNLERRKKLIEESEKDQYSEENQEPREARRESDALCHHSLQPSDAKN